MMKLPACIILCSGLRVHCNDQVHIYTQRQQSFSMHVEDRQMLLFLPIYWCMIFQGCIIFTECTNKTRTERTCKSCSDQAVDLTRCWQRAFVVLTTSCVHLLHVNSGSHLFAGGTNALFVQCDIGQTIPWSRAGSVLSFNRSLFGMINEKSYWMPYYK